MKKVVVLNVLVSFFTFCAIADTGKPYAGMENRPIKALSENDIVSLMAGKGMGLAKAAELNHYPGPKHVLDLADQIALSAEQKTKTSEIFKRMQESAQSLGAQIVAKEKALDVSFSRGAITTGELQKQLDEIAQLQSKLRYTHLVAHLEQKTILTPQQIERYDQLRGYDKSSHSDGSGMHHH